MNKPRLRIINDDGMGQNTKVLVEDQDVSSLVSHIRILPISPAGQVAAQVTFVGVELDIRGELQGPILTMDIPDESGEALSFARAFSLLYKTSLSLAVKPPAWTNYVFVGQDGTFMVEVDEEFGVRVMRKRAGNAPHTYWEEVEG